MKQIILLIIVLLTSLLFVNADSNNFNVTANVTGLTLIIDLNIPENNSQITNNDIDFSFLIYSNNNITSGNCYLYLNNSLIQNQTFNFNNINLNYFYTINNNFGLYTYYIYCYNIINDLNITSEIRNFEIIYLPPQITGRVALENFFYGNVNALIALIVVCMICFGVYWYIYKS